MKDFLRDQLEKKSEGTFCAGLPYVGTRPLKAAETQTLARRARWLSDVGVVLLALSPILFVSALVFGVILLEKVPRFESGPAPFSVLCFFGLIAPVAAAFLVGYDARSKARYYGEARAFRCVRCFAGTMSEDPTDHSQRVLVRAGLIQPDSKEHCQIELFPSNDVVYSVNGVRVRKLIRVDVTTAAARPEDVAEYAVPVDWQSDDLPFEPQRRRQSADETDEIIYYARRVRRRMWISPLLFVYLWALVVGDFLYETVKLSSSLCWAIFFAGAIALFGLLLSGPWRHTRQCKTDAGLGWVIIVPPHKHTERDGTEKTQKETIEVLPVSGAVWTIDGRPAGWRRKK
jgi:hypothetical protein